MDSKEEEEALAPAAIVRAISTQTTPGRLHKRAFADRKLAFQDNTLPTKKPRTIFQLMWMAYNDFILLLLTAAAVVSLVVGLYQTFGTVHTPSNPPIEWVEGVAILTAIIIIVVVDSVND